jgi:hypothetical protein
MGQTYLVLWVLTVADPDARVLGRSWSRSDANFLIKEHRQL